MKVLYISAASSFTSQVEKALKQNGADVLYLDDRLPYYVPAFLRGNVFLWRLTKRFSFLHKFNRTLLNRRILKVGRQFKPDALLAIKATGIQKETLATLKGMGIKTANWFPENVYYGIYVKWFREHYADYDYFLTFDSSVVQLVPPAAGQPGLVYPEKIRYVPFAVDPDATKCPPLSDEDIKRYSCDVCFVGAPYPERQKILAKIKDLDLKVYGWSGWKDTDLADCYYGPLSAVESAKAYACAKICLNMNLEPATYGVNVKTFEIPAAGGFQLSDYRQDVRGLFEIGREIAIFRNEAELIEKVRYYLEHQEERKDIASNGHKRLMRDHALKKRVAQILDILATNH